MPRASRTRRRWSRSNSGSIVKWSLHRWRSSSFSIIPVVGHAFAWRWIGKQHSCRAAVEGRVSIIGHVELLRGGLRELTFRVAPSPHANLRPLIDGNDFLTRRLAGVLAERAVKPIVFQLFEDVCAPSRTTGNGKNRGEEIRRNT